MDREAWRKFDSGRSLEGRVAIVTGAGAGIGRGIAVAFAKCGADVVIVGRTAATLEETASLIEKGDGRMHIVLGSVTERATAEGAVSEAIAKFGRLDVLVNNAHTFAPLLSVDQTPEEDFRTHMESGFFGTLYFMQAAFPQMRERGGSIINFGSIEGLNCGPGFAPYAATKEAIRALSKVAARDWGKHKVRVNIINPASRSVIADEYMSDPAIAKTVLGSIALGYLGTPEDDIAPVAVWLAGDGAHYLTGQTLNAEGGRWMF